MINIAKEQVGKPAETILNESVNLCICKQPLYNFRPSQKKSKSFLIRTLTLFFFFILHSRVAARLLKICNEPKPKYSFANSGSLVLGYSDKNFL